MARKVLPKTPPIKTPTLAMQKEAALANLDLLESLLRRYGWIQHNMGNRYEGFCLWGAAREANGWGGQSAWKALEDVVKHDCKAGTLWGDDPNQGYSVSPVTFNDDDRTSKRDITRIVRRTASLIKTSKKAKGKRFVLALYKS